MADSEISKVNILIVDDRADGLLALEAVLTSPEYRLIQASSGQDALSCLLQYECAVILLDVQMPGMDGFETARRIRENENWKDLPIIFLTAINKEIAHIYRGYECGAVDYLFKPFDPAILRTKVAVFVDLFRKNRQIRQQSQLLRREMAERMRAQKKILEIRDQEQKRIGQDLHDGLAQQLAGIAFVSKILQQKLTAEGYAEAEEAGEIMDLVRKAIYETKRIARGFYPIELEKHGLFPALQELAVNTQKQFLVSCECEFEDATQVFDLDLATHLYRISQEAVHNAIKHGKAKRIIIATARSNGHIVFSIRDDGLGFQSKDKDGMGIQTMNYRAKMIGAAFSIQRQESGGTLVSCRVEHEAAHLAKVG